MANKDKLPETMLGAMSKRETEILVDRKKLGKIGSTKVNLLI